MEVFRFSLFGVDLISLLIAPYLQALILTVIIGIIINFIFNIKKIYPTKGYVEIERAELGLSGSKIILRPNRSDKDMAYKLWVEISTRKLSLPFDPENDLIVEVYDSWYDFFQIARDLLKTIPSSRAETEDGKKIISLTMDMLNKSIRPHLTKWQAGFRRWYDIRIAKEKEGVDPRTIQREYSKYDELIKEISVMTKYITAYKAVLGKIIKAE